jgi:hypothetical protein
MWLAICIGHNPAFLKGLANSFPEPRPRPSLKPQRAATEAELMTPEEATTRVTESFLTSMNVHGRDPWEFFDWTRNTWGFQQTMALQTQMQAILAQENPAPDVLERAVRITVAVFATTGVPFNESAYGLGEAGAEVFRSALRLG